MTVEQILNEAFRLGRDLEAHASERHANPDNWDAVCEYVAAEMEKLTTQLREAGDGHLCL